MSQRSGNTPGAVRQNASFHAVNHSYVSEHSSPRTGSGTILDATTPTHAHLSQRLRSPDEDIITVQKAQRTRTGPVYAKDLPLSLQELLDRYYHNKIKTITPPPVTGTRIVSSSQDGGEVEWYHVPTGERLEAMVRNFEVPGLVKKSARGRDRRLIWVQGPTVSPFIVRFGVKSGTFDWGRGSVFNKWYGADKADVAVDSENFEIIASVHRRCVDTMSSVPRKRLNSEVYDGSQRSVGPSQSHVSQQSIMLSPSPENRTATGSLPPERSDASITGSDDIQHSKRFKATLNNDTPQLANQQSNSASPDLHLSEPMLSRPVHAVNQRSSAPRHFAVALPRHDDPHSHEAIRSRGPDVVEVQVVKDLHVQAPEAPIRSNRDRRTVVASLENVSSVYGREHMDMFRNVVFLFRPLDSTNNPARHMLARVRPYKYCQSPEQLFFQALSARFWKPNERRRVLALDVDNRSYGVTISDPDLDDPSEVLETFNTFIANLADDLNTRGESNGYQEEGQCEVNVFAVK